MFFIACPQTLLFDSWSSEHTRTKKPLQICARVDVDLYVSASLDVWEYAELVFLNMSLPQCRL